MRARLEEPLRAWFALASELGQAARASEPFEPMRLDRRDPELIARLLPAFEALGRSWMRARYEGLSNIPHAPALFVANHNGGILGPDLPCTMAMLWRALGPSTPLYAMTHDFAMRVVTPLGRVLQRVGGMRAHPESARLAFETGASVLCYPGGELDAYRHYRDRDRIRWGTRTGFLRVARDAGVPIVPIVAHNAHRSSIILHEGERIAQLLGMKERLRLTRFPIALGLPWGVGFGPWVPFLPLPLPISIRVLAPIQVPSNADLDALREQVVRRMQHALDALAFEARTRLASSR